MTATLERTALAVDQAALHRATAWAGRALQKRASHPALSGMVLTSTEEGLTVSAYDQSTYCTATVDTQGDLGRLLVNGTMLSAFAERATKSEVTLTVVDRQLAITTTRDRYRLQLMLVEEYPSVPRIPVECGATYGLAAGLARVVHAAADTAIGDHQVQCVRLYAEGERLWLFCAQAGRFARAEVEWDGPAFDAVLDARRLLDVVRPLGEEVRVGFNDNLLSVSADGLTAVLTLNAGRFTPAKQLQAAFEQPLTRGHADVDRDELLDALARTSPAVQGALGAVDVAFERDLVTLTSATEELADAGTEVPCHLEMEPDTYRFTASAFKEAVHSIPSGVVRVSPGLAGRAPVLVLAGLTGEGRPDPAVTHIIAPRRRTS